MAEETIQDQPAWVLYSTLLGKAETLISELKLFRAYLNDHHINVCMSKFCKDVENEVKAIRQVKLIHNDMNDQDNAGLHRLRSSNLVFYEAVWNIAKQNKNVIALQRRTRWVPSHKAGTDRVGSRNHLMRADMANLKLKEHIAVDVVAEQGRKWIKVWTKSSKRLLLDLAKEGLVRTDSSDEDDFLGDDNNSLRLTRLASDLRDAANNVRAHHQHPVVHFILPNIVEGAYVEIDSVLRAIRATGAVVECGIATLANPEERNSLMLEKVFSSMTPVPNLQADLTSTINLDCTLIVALVSDISHVNPIRIVVPQHYEGSTFRTINGQIKSEVERPVLENDLYPILCDRRLVCTEDVAAHMQKILHPMGTPSELARMNIVLGHGEYVNKTSGDLRMALQKHSTYSVPSNLQLPIKPFPFDLEDLDGSKSGYRNLTPEQYVAQQLHQHPKLTYLNASAFLSGWTRSITTVTLNRTIANWIVRHIDEILDELDRKETTSPGFSGPSIHFCSRDRSLLGSEKSSVE